jgi:hypothetical protein
MATERELYEKFMYEQFLQSQQAPAAVNEDIPTGGDLAGTAMPAETEKKDKYGIKDTFLGMLETAAAMTTGAIGGTAGHVYGAIDGLVGGGIRGMEFGTGEMAENMAGRANEVAGALTYAPRTEAGQEFTEALGGAMAPLEALEPIMPALGALPNPSRISAVPDKKAAEIEQALDMTRGQGDPTRMGNPDQQWNGAMYPGLTRDKSAEDLMVSGSVFMAPEHVQAFKNADPATKAKMQKMQEEAKASQNGVNAQHSPYNVIADEFASRSETLGQVGEAYLADMSKAMEAVDQMDSNNVRTLTGELQQSVAGMLREYGIKWDPATGTIDKKSLQDSKVFNGQGKVVRAVERFMQGTTTQSGIRDARSNYATFEDLHNLKISLQQAGYGAARNQGSGDLSTALIKRMSGMVNDTARTISPEYGAANDGLSSVITSMQELADATGTKVDLNESNFTREEWRKVSNASRKLTSNYDSGVNLDETLKRMDEQLVAESNKRDQDGNYVGHVTDGQMNELNLVRDENGNFVQGTNPRELALFAHYMNAFYGDGKVTSFRGLTQQANNHLDTMAANALWGNNAAVTGQVLGWTNKMKSNERKLKDRTKATHKDIDLNNTARTQIEDALNDVLWRGVPFL